MEKDFYTDDFEQLLKDTTDDFRMYPSRKVWHSIYNDLHPAKKWPSFAVSLLLITAILYIGIDNNNAINADADNIILSTLSPQEKQNGVTKNVNRLATTTLAAETNGEPVAVTASASTPATGLSLSEEPGIYRNTAFSPLPNESQLSGTVSAPLTLSLPYRQEVVSLRSPASYAVEMPDQRAASVKSSNPGTAEAVDNDSPTKQGDEHGIAIIHQKNQETTTALPLTNTVDVTNALPAHTSITTAKAAEEKAWIDNYAFHNARKGNKWKTKFSTLVYITPSVGYRVLNRNNSFEPVNALLIRSSATTVDADDAITQQAAMNLESGATAILDLSRRLRVKGGIQFNYTNYVSSAERLSHPTQTNLLLNDISSGNTMLVPVSSTYGNKAGMQSMRLNNNTIQLSLPVGADYKLAGNDKLKWYVGATIQPTYVAGGNAYLVSSDYKNYVDMPSMLRTWNVNAGFESFISYKTKGGSVINFGPQFRYQILSTYSSRYTYTENLYNVGVKVGITRKF